MSTTLRKLYRRLEADYLQGYDLMLIGTTVLLVLIGLLMVFSASTSLADRLHGSSLVVLRNHLVHMAVGLAALAVGMRVPYAVWRRYTPVLLLVTFLLLILVLIPGVGHQVGGARRWLRLGFLNFQPTEGLKLVLILFVASYLDRKHDLLEQFFRGVAPSLSVMGVFLTLVVMQPDFGTMALIALTLLLMIFVGGAKPGHILFSIAGFGLIGVVLVMSRSYRIQRILAFLDPWSDRLDSGFQIIQSYLAMGSGGWLGVGLGDSTQKMFFLPDAHTDFIFAILAEEMGLAGVLVVMGLFACFVWRGYVIALGGGDDYGKLVAYGLTTLFALQILLNMAVVMGLLPTKGLPLPFISYGGSALVMSLFMTGVLLNIGKGRLAAA